MGRFRDLAAWVVAILLAGAFLLTGGMKLAGSPAIVEAFRHWGFTPGFVTLIGVVEVVGAALSLFPATALYGALLIGAVMVGALATHLSHGEWAMAIVPLALGLLAAWLATLRRPDAFGLGALQRPHEFVSTEPERHDDLF